MSAGNSPADRLRQFFDYVWGDIGGYVYLPTKDETGAWKKVLYEWPVRKNAVISHVLANSAAGKDVYFSPAIFSKPNPGKEYVLGSSLIWVEYDGKAPSEWPEADSEGVSATPGPPSLRVQSSTETHQHVYWKLEEFCKDVDFIEAANRTIAYQTHADTSGWDANQVLRPPHTVNYKHNLDVVWLEENDNTYHPKQFRNIKTFRELVSTQIDTTDLPDTQVIIGKYTWNPDTLELLLKEANDVVHGMRSSALMRIAFHLAELGATDAEAYAILNWADNKWGKFKNRSDRTKRLIDLINKARMKYPKAVEEKLNSEKVETDVQYVFGFGDMLKHEVNIEWAIKDLMPRGGLGMIGAASGVGKTQIMLNLAIHSALSREFLGWKPIGRQKLLFLELEMGIPTFKYFVAQMSQGYSEAELEVLQNRLLLAPINETIPLSNAKARQFFESILAEHAPDGIVVDSFGKVHTGGLNDDEEIRKTMVYINRIRKEFGCYVWVIHHNRKGQEGNKKPKRLDDLYGNQYLTTDLDIAMSLWKEEDGSLELRVVKNRLAVERPPIKIQRIEHLQFEELGGVQPNLDRMRKSDSPESIGLSKGVLPGGESKANFRFG